MTCYNSNTRIPCCSTSWTVCVFASVSILQHNANYYFNTCFVFHTLKKKIYIYIFLILIKIWDSNVFLCNRIQSMLYYMPVVLYVIKSLILLKTSCQKIFWPSCFGNHREILHYLSGSRLLGFRRLCDHLFAVQTHFLKSQACSISLTLYLLRNRNRTHF